MAHRLRQRVAAQSLIRFGSLADMACFLTLTRSHQAGAPGRRR
jgi:hypothetical protein